MKNKKAIVVVSVIVGLAAIYGILVLTGVAKPEPKPLAFEVISSSAYVRDGKECIAYRATIGEQETNDKRILEAFEKITENDEYYLHTVFFYTTKEAATGAFDRYKVEEISQYKKPEIIKAGL